MAQDQERPSSENEHSIVGGNRLDRRHLRAEWAAVIVACIALIVSVLTAIKQDNLGKRQAELGERQNIITKNGIQSTRFQSIYERMLDIDKMLADKPALAKVIYQVDANTAAEIYVLDFDQYAWDNVRYIIKPDAALYPSLFALRKPLPGSEPVEKTDGWTDGEWESWQTWSETIVGHFRSPSDNPESDPGQLCSALNNSRAAYATEFVDAVRSQPCVPRSGFTPFLSPAAGKYGRQVRATLS